MQVNILHDGALTVELESNGTVILHTAGDCPTSDDMSYMVPEELTSDDMSDEVL